MPQNRQRTTLKLNGLIPLKDKDQQFPEDYIQDMDYLDGKLGDLINDLVKNVPSLFYGVSNLALVSGTQISIPEVKGFVFDEKGILRPVYRAVIPNYTPDISAGDGTYYVKYKYAESDYGSQRQKVFVSETYYWETIDALELFVDRSVPTLDTELCVGSFMVVSGNIISVDVGSRSQVSYFNFGNISIEEKSIIESWLSQSVQDKLNSISGIISRVFKFRGGFSSIHQMDSRRGKLISEPLVDAYTFFCKEDGSILSRFDIDQEYATSRKAAFRVTGADLSVGLKTSLSELAADKMPFTFPVGLNSTTHKWSRFKCHTVGSGFAQLRVIIHDDSDTEILNRLVSFGDLSVDGWFHVEHEIDIFTPGANYHYHIYVADGSYVNQPFIYSNISGSMEEAYFQLYFKPTPGLYKSNDVIDILNGAGASMPVLRVPADDNIIGGLAPDERGELDIIPVDFSDDGVWTSWEYGTYIGIDAVTGRIKLPSGYSLDDWGFANFNFKMPIDKISDKFVPRYNNSTRSLRDFLDVFGFLNLVDAPSSYTGEAGKMVVVKMDETGIEFADVPDHFTELQDVPASYTGHANKVVKVKATEDGLEFGDPETDVFTDLEDVPSSYSGQGGKKVNVKAAEDGLEFRDNDFLDMEDTPSDYIGQAGKAVMVKPGEDGLEFGDMAAAFTELTDAPASYSGKGLQEVRVKSDESGLEFHDKSNEVDFLNTDLNKNTGMLIPMYIYPNDLRVNDTWDTTTTPYGELIKAMRKYPKVPVMAILNPASGPGTVTDGNYTVAITLLQGAKGKTLGYIATGYSGVGEKSVVDIKAEMDTWLSLYPGIDGIFLDEMPNDGNRVADFQEIKAYGHSNGLFPIIGNPGTQLPQAYLDGECCDVYVTAEGASYPTEHTLFGDTWAGTPRDYNLERFAGLVYAQASLDAISIKMMKKYLGYIYVTDDDAPNPWDTLPAYIEELFNILALDAEEENTFAGLLDTPDTYSAQGGKIVKVKGDESGLEFGDITAATGRNLVYNGEFELYSNRIVGASNWYDYKHPDGWIYADDGNDGKIGYDSVNECCKIVTSSDGTAMSLSQGLHEFLRWGNYLKGNQVSVRLNIKGSSNIICRLYDGVSTITETLTGAGAIENIDLQIDVSSSATGLWIDVITTGNSETIELYHCYGNVGPDTLPGLPCQIQEIGLWQGQGEDYPDNVFEGDTTEIPAGYTRLESFLNGRFGIGGNGRSKLPEYQGRFLRVWANGSANDPDRATRFMKFIVGTTAGSPVLTGIYSPHLSPGQAIIVSATTPVTTTILSINTDAKTVTLNANIATTQTGVSAAVTVGDVSGSKQANQNKKHDHQVNGQHDNSYIGWRVKVFGSNDYNVTGYLGCESGGGNQANPENINVLAGIRWC